MKYEDIYLRAYETPRELQRGLERYFHSSTTRAGDTRRTPDAVYFGELGMPQAA